MNPIQTFLKSLGCYPPEYNRAVHGSYDPARYYGPKDTNFADLKLNEISSWFGRRNKSVRAFMGVLSRWRHRHYEKYNLPLKAKSTWVWQFFFLYFVWSYAIQYGHTKHHRNAKYHW